MTHEVPPGPRPPRRRLRQQAVAVAVGVGLSGALSPPPAGADQGSALTGAVALSHAAPAPAAGGPAPVAGPAPAAVPDPAHLALPAAPGAGPPAAAPPAGPSAPPPVAAQQPQKVTGHTTAAPTATGAPFGSPAPAPPPATTDHAPPAAAAAATRFRAATGVPLPSDPTRSLAALGPVALGVPNFFIEKFRIPPFLIPIYEAAGIQYGVPWQVLAAINEIETDYGRNLTVSTAGALGWMQMLPQTWQEYGVDANNDGVKDPYNPEDAIFAAARFLRAAGAEQSLRRAIFAYNSAGWYVDSVLLRARLIGGLPSDLLTSLTGLTDGSFPVGAASTYADDPAEAASLARRTGAPSSATAPAGIQIYSRVGAPVVAVKDGVVTGLGESAALGRYVQLRDGYGNTYIYSGLKIVPALYATPKPPSRTAAPTHYALLPADPAPRGPASAGHQTATPPATPPAAPPAPTAAAAGGAPVDAFARTYGLPRAEADLSPLRVGARVDAGAILGRVGVTDPTRAAHLTFQIRPAGPNAPLIDPKPILDGWKLLESTSTYRSAALAPLAGPGAANPSIGQLLLETKSQLAQQVLADPTIDIYPCGRADIRSGQVDQRVLAPLALLSAAGLKPTVSTLRCPGTPTAAAASTGAGQPSAADAAGTGVEIAKINGTPVLGHQGPGSPTEAAIRRLLTLQGSFRPDEIISLLSYPAAGNTLAMPDHADRLGLAFNAPYDPAAKPAQQVGASLTPKQWLLLIARLGQIANPGVLAQPSSAAIPAPRGR